MTERSDRAGAIAFAMVVVIVGAAVVVMLFLEPGELRSSIAGFIGGIVAVFAVGVARWIGGGRQQRRPDRDP